MGKTWLGKDELSDALQIEVGHVRQVKIPGGAMFAVPKSKSFAECSQEEFNDYFRAARGKLYEWCEFDAVAAYLRHMRGK